MKWLILALSLGIAESAVLADGAIVCKRDSTGPCKGRQYCCYVGTEAEGDKYCHNLGCVRAGTSSCPTASNVSSCGTRDRVSTDAELPWCVEPEEDCD